MSVRSANADGGALSGSLRGYLVTISFTLLISQVQVLKFLTSQCLELFHEVC